ncbi:MAG: hypothetical protein R3D84_09340 [Paracoccaceae bacterium]
MRGRAIALAAARWTRILPGQYLNSNETARFSTRGAAFYSHGPAREAADKE